MHPEANRIPTSRRYGRAVVEQVPGAEPTVYERVGGRPFFDALAARFYEGVAADPVLRPLYPADLGPATAHLAGFLAQYWGGPPEYSATRGHPRLRMRHMPFRIGAAERDAWARHMVAAVRASGAPADVQEAMEAYFTQAAAHLVNVADA